MTKHPEATTVTLLLVAEKLQRKGLEESAADVLEHYFRTMPDEQKVDLYALLAERLTAEMPLGQMEEAVSRCLWDNQNHWARRYG